MTQVLLAVNNLSTRFYTHDGVVRAVNDVSFSVDQGETIALVGESGCGKTVSALSLLRLVTEPPGKVESGEAVLEGVDLLKLSAAEMRRVRGGKVAMVFQEPMTSLNPVLPVGRQISEALEMHRDMTRNQALRETVRLLEAVGIPQADRRAREYPHQFSGGMRQRVMIAMAISCQPKLIIADEPTTAVDVTIQAQLLHLISGITREQGTAVILITHNLGIVARYAQRVFVMYAGSIVECGPAMALYRDPRHPYTLGLLASVPRLDRPKRTRLLPIHGQPPDLIAPSEGCAFMPRCGYAGLECTSVRSLLEVAPGHYTMCPTGLQESGSWKKTCC